MYKKTLLTRFAQALARSPGHRHALRRERDREALGGKEKTVTREQDAARDPGQICRGERGYVADLERFRQREPMPFRRSTSW
jgi:hypothetical protein